MENKQKKQINFTFASAGCRMRDFAVCDADKVDAAKESLSRMHSDVVFESVVDKADFAPAAE